MSYNALIECFRTVDDMKENNPTYELKHQSNAMRFFIFIRCIYESVKFTQFHPEVMCSVITLFNDKYKWRYEFRRKTNFHWSCHSKLMERIDG